MWFQFSVNWLDKYLVSCGRFLEGLHLRANCTFGWEIFDFERSASCSGRSRGQRYFLMEEI